MGRGESARCYSSKMPTDGFVQWSEGPISRRVQWAGRWRKLIAQSADALCALAEREVGKPDWQGLTGDVLPLLASLKWHEKNAAKILRPQRLGGRPVWLLGQRHEVRRAPIGTVAIIATWNYPIQLLGVQVAQALIAGNRVIVKPSEVSPRTQEALLRLAVRAGLPEGVLTWTNATRQAGAELLRNTKIDHVVFTGSTGVGRQVAAWAAQELVPTSLELSGNDSAIVLGDADPELAARSIWQGVVMNAGQTCMAPRRAIVSRAVYRRFCMALEALAAGTGGLGRGGVLRLATPGAGQTVHGLVAEAVRMGGRVAVGVNEPAPRTDDDPDRVRATAVLDCPADAPLARGGHFGPVLAVIVADDDEAAIGLHSKFDQKLSTAVFTADATGAQRLAARLGSSFVTINDCVLPTSHPGASIAGIGPSGWGVTRGRDGLLAMTRAVCVSRTSTWLRLPARRPDAPTLRRMRQMMQFLYGGDGSASLESLGVRLGDTAAAAADSPTSTAASTGSADAEREAKTGLAAGPARTRHPET